MLRRRRVGHHKHTAWQVIEQHANAFVGDTAAGICQREGVGGHLFGIPPVFRQWGRGGRGELAAARAASVTAVFAATAAARLRLLLDDSWKRGQESARAHHALQM
eukprot:349824-Chlamydomonas_euryale.AAC.2